MITLIYSDPRTACNDTDLKRSEDRLQTVTLVFEASSTMQQSVRSKELVDRRLQKACKRRRHS